MFLDATDLLDAELSLLAFQRRVLALADNPNVPLLERLRFLGIVTSNMDELYMVRMAEVRRAAIDELTLTSTGRTSKGGLEEGPAARRLKQIEQEIAALLKAQSECAERCLRAVAQAGVRLVTWESLTARERDALRTRYLDEIQPDLMPHAITLSPGHPLPHLPHLGLFVAVVFRDAPGARTRLAEHELPGDVPRFLPVEGRPGVLIPIEEVLRANVYQLHPGVLVEGTYLFRVTRGGDLRILEEDSPDLLGAVALATEQRPNNPAVRVEVERSMPAHVGVLILESLRREAIGRDMELTVDAVQVVDGLLDLRCLQSLPLPRGVPFEYPSIAVRSPVGEHESMFDVIRARDLLVHHPFEAFDQTVVRFLQEAAADPAVTHLFITLYRVGNPSPVVEALLQSARSGKQVFVLVELQARFDEEHNVHWARTLEKAGGKVVYGSPGLKVHAKVALVVRREPVADSPEDKQHGVGNGAGERHVERRYVHVGTGNYNTRSGRQYTDLSLFSARAELVEDAAQLFESLAARQTLPHGLANGALVAPHQLLPALLARIAQETANAKLGLPAGITIKVNGLADTEVVRALYAASTAGVRIDLIVRGICTLRPGVPGQSENIRVMSIVGRFLEHSRIYRFANGGRPTYLVGSSDLRPRNLRRRVELLVPVSDEAHQRQLDSVLELYLNDPTAWELRSDGRYVYRDRSGDSAQVYLASPKLPDHSPIG